MNAENNNHEERRKRGIYFLVVGAVLLLLGFIFTVINYHTDQSFTIIMYGTSTVGIFLLFFGLYLIMG